MSSPDSDSVDEFIQMFRSSRGERYKAMNQKKKDERKEIQSQFTPERFRKEYREIRKKPFGYKEKQIKKLVKSAYKNEKYMKTVYHLLRHLVDYSDKREEAKVQYPALFEAMEQSEKNKNVFTTVTVPCGFQKGTPIHEASDSTIRFIVSVFDISSPCFLPALEQLLQRGITIIKH